MNFLDVHPTHLDKPIPAHKKDDPIPYLTQWSCHSFIILHALWPVAIQYAYYLYAHHNLHPVATWALYSFAFRINGYHEASILRRFGHRFGFLDGDQHARDQVPDIAGGKVLASILLTTAVRSIFTVWLTYNRDEAPSFSWWLPVELGIYAVVLDFWFYIYHRSCHEVGGLWQFHRTHHLTKHPTPLLSAYADEVQEMIEIAIVPLLTYTTLKLVGFPLGFYDWWICHQYIIFSEAMGHSGVRIYSTTPGTATWILQFFDCELVIEDHDLHHRNGWRKSYNYGKQTRLWDRVFGSCGKRIESDISNVDRSLAVSMPLI